MKAVCVKDDIVFLKAIISVACDKFIKSSFIIGLLMFNSHVFCTLDKSMYQAARELCYATVAAASGAITIGACSYAIDFLLSKFELTKNLENRGNIATSSCAVLYLLFLVSEEYQRMSYSSTEIQKRDCFWIESDMVEIVKKISDELKR